MLALYLSMLETDDDKRQFEDLYNKYLQDMYAIAYNILNNQADAEDAVHQSLLYIAENFKKISKIPCNEIKAYIVIISRNTAINFYRKNKYTAEHSAELNENIPDDYFEQADYSDLIDAIKTLPQKYKDVMYLFYLQNFSAKETAKILHISDNAVRQRALRGKLMLKEILERSEVKGGLQT